ncbi:unnamed protein product (macronuclear) [Paramecium tetraurelia]|uniref:Transmembrane protein n=1 Tax=Paramecium tetraurelia TaxID=5888 RepID=A0CTF6_PARTE|nr:uncharacterized protein GSPATT00010307001 [Paramecium tetraurelia]CAK74073.1 unnamed protein product [Paramecium tetraurelia]|eukprot:XP_001441470.1 hypothetical protein (macronuclear) [Paramecium tetraurelia strain d4-2]
MNNNLLIIVFFSAWTLLFLLILFIGYLLDKSYQLASISPQTKSITPSCSLLTINPIMVPNAQKQQSIRKVDEEFNIVNNNYGQQNQQVNQENGQVNLELNTSPRRRSSDKKSPSRSPKKFQMQQTIIKKLNIGTYDGADTLQSTNRKSVRSRPSVVNSERNSVYAQSPGQRITSIPRISSVSNFQISGQFLVDSIYKIPKPLKDYYKCHQLSKIYFTHKDGISRTFMTFQIYFRQITCFEICGLLLIYTQNLSFYIIMGATCGGYVVLKVLDYHLIKKISKGLCVQALKILNYTFWLSIFAVFVFGIIWFEINNSLCIIYYLPALIMEIIVDPLRYLIIKYCLADSKKVQKEKFNQVNVLKVMEQIK